jgi:hypothetical protein
MCGVSDPTSMRHVSWPIGSTVIAADLLTDEIRAFCRPLR